MSLTLPLVRPSICSQLAPISRSWSDHKVALVRLVHTFGNDLDSIPIDSSPCKSTAACLIERAYPLETREQVDAPQGRPALY